VCYFFGSLFADWASGCYLRCGCIGSPVYRVSGGWCGGEEVFMSTEVCDVCYFLGSLFADWASGCYVCCGCIGSPVYRFSGGWCGGEEVFMSTEVCDVCYFLGSLFADWASGCVCPCLYALPENSTDRVLCVSTGSATLALNL